MNFVALLLLFFAMPVIAAPKGGMLSIGLARYKPTLEEARKYTVEAGYGELTDDSDQSIFVSLRVPTKKDSWSEVSYMKWSGESTNGNFKINVHNFGTTYLAIATTKTVSPYLGAGGNLIYMRREISGFFDTTHNDWLWGLNGTAGLCVNILPWLGVEARYMYIWSKQSTLGGTEYDLGDGVVTGAVTLIF